MSLATTPALARLRGRLEAPPASRVFVHRGSCSSTVGTSRVIDTILTTLGARGSLAVEAACDGACWAAPAATVVRPTHRHRFAYLDRESIEALLACLDRVCDDAYAGSGARGLLARVGHLDGSIADALAQGAYAAFAHAVTRKPEEVIDAVQHASGAHLATARAWRLAERDRSQLLVVTAAGGDAGNLHLLEGDPHRLIEGILMTAHATGVTRAVIEVSPEASDARRTAGSAIAQARAAGLLDGSTLGGAGVEIEVRGSGADRAATESLSLDVEALCAVTTVYDEPPPPTRLLALSGAVSRPGLYEVPVDGVMAWSGVLAAAGANPQRVGALRLGGPSGRVIRSDAFEEPLELRDLSSAVVALSPDDFEREAAVR
ncbi:MAG: hypothetical protein EXR68_04820 [Dehalococcoidia bacterium]|nr:hypothetical protein [Dehalococcoidia bacterium]